MSKKKICIGIISVLAIFILSCLVIMFLRKEDVQIANNEENNFPVKNNITSEVEECNVIDESNIIENTILEEKDVSIPKEKSSTIEEKIELSSKKQKNIQDEQVNSPIKTPSVPNQEIPQQAEKGKSTEEKATPIINEEPKENPKQETEDKKQENTKEEIQKPIEDKPQMVTQYVRNDVMINQIKQVIHSNESEFMKTYGYEIVVDSSIKNITNQFTFSDIRVKSSITHKFGTIRIYAEDYYVNGNLLMTECYIL